MKVLKLTFKNLFRYKIRTFLTIVGIAIAIMAYTLLRTVVTAWNYGVEASSVNRLISTHAVTFFYPLPVAYREKILQIPGVKNVTWVNWFQGQYKDNKLEEFFPRSAVEVETFFKIYSEFKISDKEMEDFLKDRQGCIVGEKTAKLLNIKIGDIIPIEGDIYPGKWEFVVRGIYTAKNPDDKSVDLTQMFFNWKYLDEQLLKDTPGREGYVGWFVTELNDPNQSGRISKEIDELFVNATDATKTKTEKAFQQSFVSLSGAIITSLEVISYFIVGIILLVLVNTMMMSARERTQEYAIFKSLGFKNGHIFWMITGESLLISILGGALGILTAFPIVKSLGEMFSTMFPVFEIKTVTILIALIFSISVGILAALSPGIRSTRMKIVDGLRQIG